MGTAWFNPFRYRRSTKLGRFAELFTLSLLILIFIAVALDRIWALRVLAEQTGVMHTEGAIRAALGVHVMEQVLADKHPDLTVLDGANPMDLLDPEHLPPNYLGELAADPAEVPGFRWYFDSVAKVLIYRVGNEEYFQSDLDGPPRILFRLNVPYEDMNQNGKHEQGEPVTGVLLSSSMPYHWVTP